MNTLRIHEVMYKGEKQKQLIGTCKLVSPLSKKEIEYTNDDGEIKSYRIANVKGLLPSGKVIDLTASVPQRTQELMEENGGEFEVGESYLTTVTAQPDRKDPTKLIFFARMSHLTNAGTDNNAIAAEFGAEFGFTSVEQSMTPKMAQKVIQDNLVDEEVIA
jgi:hypothetical protein